MLGILDSPSSAMPGFSDQSSAAATQTGSALTTGPMTQSSNQLVLLAIAAIAIVYVMRRR